MIYNFYAPNDILYHKKTGGFYMVVGRCFIEKTMEDCYVYRGRDGRMWVRPAEEMEDGRFQLHVTMTVDS